MHKWNIKGMYFGIVRHDKVWYRGIIVKNCSILPIQSRDNMPKIAGSNMITVEDCTTVMLSTDSALQATTSAQERIDVGTFA